LAASPLSLWQSFRAGGEGSLIKLPQKGTEKNKGIRVYLREGWI
jgi:hypothetical protein